MATSPKASTSEDGKSPPQPNIAVVLLILTVIAGGAGAGFSFAFVAPKPQSAVAAPAKEPEKVAEKHEQHSSRFPPDAMEMALDPIVASLGPDAKTKMRLEVSMIVTKEAASAPLLKKEMAEDIVTFLNGVTVADISGTRGFQNLREDLNDRARIRGRGMVFGLLISGFVVE